MVEGIFICAAPHSLKFFLKKSKFESYIHVNQTDLLQHNKKEKLDKPERSDTKQSWTLDTTLRGSQKPGSHCSSNHQLVDHEDKARCQKPRDQPPLQPHFQLKSPLFYRKSDPSDPQSDNHPMDLDGSSQTSMQQQNIDNQGGRHQDYGQSSDQQ